MIKSVSIIGAGNVAQNIGRLLRNSGVTVDSVYSRNTKRRLELAEMLDAKPVHEATKISVSSDLLLFAVRDDALSELVPLFQDRPQLMAHTSGSVDVSVFGNAARPSVFYPLQTFTADKEYSGAPFPICIEAKLKEDLVQLKRLAKSLVGQENVHKIDSGQRKTLHIAAVFACNFTNYFYSVAEQILKTGGIEFDILKPLILETINKIDGKGPSHYQTGPAVRGDKKTIAEHLEHLRFNEDYRTLYKLLSDRIHKKR